MSSLTQQSLLLFVGRMLALVFTFVTPFVVVRTFSTEEFGLYKQLFLIYGTFISTLSFGFTASLYYFLPREPGRRHIYISQALLVLCIAGFLGALAVVALKAPIARALNNPLLEVHLPYFAAFLILSLVTSVIEILMISLKEAKLASLTYLTSEMLRAFLVIGAAVFTHDMLIVILALILWGVCRLGGLLLYLRRIGIHGRARPDAERLGAQFSYSVPFGLAVIARSLSDTFHLYVVSYLYSPSLFAIYAAGWLRTPLIAIAFESMSDVALVRLTELQKKGMTEEASRVIAHAVQKLSLIFFPLYVWLTINAGDIVVLIYTARFESATSIFLIFLLTIPLTAVGLDYVPRAFADTRFIFNANVLRLLLAVILVLLLAGPFGPVGIALATVLAMGITKSVIMYRVRRLLELPLSRLLPWRRLGHIGAMAAVSGVAVWMLNPFWPAHLGLRILFSGLSFALTYSLLVWHGAVLDAVEKQWVTDVARQAVGLTGIAVASTTKDRAP